MGAKDSKPSFISYEDAVKRVSDSELRRIREAFKKCAGANGTTLSLEAFVHEVLCDAVPFEVAEWLFQICGGTKRGIAFKDLACGIIVLTKGTLEEKIKFLWSLYVNNDNSLYIYKRDFTRALHIENNSLPVSEVHRSVEILTSLFGPNEKITFDQFCSWFLIHKNATVLSKWLLSDHNHLDQELDTPTFYQSLAGVTHLEEKEIIELEKCFWSLRAAAPSGELDAASFTPLLSPPFPPECVHGVFQEIIELEKCFWSLRAAAPSGELDAASFTPLLSPPFPPECVHGVFQAFDENRDGHVDFKELCCGISAACRGPIAERLKFCFKMFDSDRDGLLNRRELVSMTRVLCEVANEEARVEGSRASTPDGDGPGFQPEVVLLSLQDKLVTLPADKPAFKLGPITDDDIDTDIEEDPLFTLVPPAAALPLSEFLVWGADAAALLTPLRRRADRLCHVVLGLRPSCAALEREIVLGWLRHAEAGGLVVGQFWYLVHRAWWARWTAWTRQGAGDHCHADCECSSWSRAECGSVSSWGSAGAGAGAGAPPGTIDNTPLLDTNNTYQKVPTLTGEGGLLRRDAALVQHAEFSLLPAPLWRALTHWYPHNKPLPRQVIRPSNADVELELYPIQLELWRHLPAATRAPASLSGVSAFSAGLPAAPAHSERYLAYTAAFSRLATVKQVCEFVCGALGLQREDARLWLLEDAAAPPGRGVLLDDDSLTLEALGLKHGTKILLEKRSPDLTWPEELAALRGRGVRTERRATLAAPECAGATGLHNLGNTCYMNSALQAIWNTAPLRRYFTSGTYLHEINTSNPLGTRGQLALRFGQLCNEVWSSGGGSVAPLRVRLTVSRFARHLANNQQHDAQELLAWLMDALHEDLRRPPLHAPPAGEQESWAQYLSRNNSIMAELFYGLLQSRVVCAECARPSVRTEPFNVLSLPLPVDTAVRRHATVFLADGSIPTKYGISVPCDATVRELKMQIQQLSGLHPDTLLVTEAAGALISRVFSDEVKASSTSTELLVLELPADEDDEDGSVDVASSDECSCDSGVCVGAGADVSGAGAPGAGAGEVSAAASLCMPALFCFQRPRSELAASPPGLASRCHTLPRDLSKYHQASSESSPTPSVRSLNFSPSARPPAPPAPRAAEVTDMKTNKIQYLIAVHRKQVRCSSWFLRTGRARSSLFGVPRAVAVQHGGGGRALYRRVLHRLAHLLSSAPAGNNNNHAHDCDDSLGYEFPFTLRVVNRSGLWCGVCGWQAACRGCSLPPSDAPLVYTMRSLPPTDTPLIYTMPKSRCSISGDSCRVHGNNNRIFDDTSQSTAGGELQELDLYSLRKQGREVMLAIDWEPTALHLRYQTAKEKTCIEHPSVAALRARSSAGVSLASCLRAFTAEETLDAAYSCGACKQPRAATKALRLYRAPPYLIIHLKRFQFVNNKWIKSTVPVSFPLEDLDPAEYLAAPPRAAPPPRDTNTSDRGSELEDSLSDDDASCTSTDALKSPPAPRGRDPCRGRVTSPSPAPDDRVTSPGPAPDDRVTSPSADGPVTSPGAADDPVDYHQHHLLDGQDPRDLKYRLYAVVSHSGQLSSGHYTCLARHSSGAWLHYNDSTVRLQPHPPPPPAAAAYLLLYERHNLHTHRYLPDVSDKPAVSEEDSLESDENDLRKMCVLT